MMTTPWTADVGSYGIETHWFNQRPARRTILIAYAHPDDESFGNGGTIARYAAEGVAVHYACATRGECGTVDPALLGGRDIAALRSEELFCAARTLGMAAVHFLGYRDSGMAGTPDNQHPAALVQAPQEQVTGQIVALIRALRPQVVITFNPYGGYGHPDHIAIHMATIAAFQAAGDASRYHEQIGAGLTPWAPAKLYYSTFRTRTIRLGIAMLRLMRRDPRRFGRNGDIDIVRVVEEVTPATAAIASGAYLEQREQAWHCHRSQFEGGMRFQWLPTAIRRRMSVELFTRVVPAWRPGQPVERDLFAGLPE